MCMQVEALDAALPWKLSPPDDGSVTTQTVWKTWDIQ